MSAASPMLSSSSSCDTISRIHVKARWLTRMLAWVRATLDDAEDMDITEESIRDWLRDLQEVADAAEDLLDEFPHEALRLGFVGDGGWTAGSITELPRQRKRTSEMAMLHDQRMEEIVSRFMKIKKPEQALKLDYRKEQMDAESIYASRTTSSVIEEPHIVGRHEDLANIKQFLLTSDTEEPRGSDDMDDHVSVMAIAGMGGLGKTTLAQLAYQDDQVNQHFQLKSWVCVSEDFDVIRLTKALLQSLNVEDSGLSELDPLQQKLVQKLKGKERLLLVLDDVWEAENLDIHNWNLLTAPLCNRSADTKIIMTTRSRKVSEMAPRASTYDLGFLSDEDTLELFMQHAFEGRDPNLYQNLVAIGKETARKCRGVPLAAKTLGGLLCNEDDNEWNKILESEVWNATINQEGSIIPILRLSYRHLPAPLKRCFRYCSLFPKDFVFDRNKIICTWMAQGFIKANRREFMEDIGERYIDNLLSRSFFQKHPSNPKRLQMHDLMHDLAICVSGDECYSIEGDKPCLILSHVRHLSILPTSDFRAIISSIEGIPEEKSFRSFLFSHKIFNLSIFGRVRLSDSYTRMKHLRVLDLGGVRLDHLPESITHLKHLRYLRIADIVQELPEFVGSMYHLQTLDAPGVRELPNNMSNLPNLRHLRSSCTIEYPVGIGKLADLQTMPGFLVSPEHDHAKLGELKDMNNIRGEFAIKGLENLADVNEAKKACLDKKRGIRSLCLEWNPKADSSLIDDEVLESLKPSPKLESLQISGFKGPSYPSWWGDGSFSRLGTIKLKHCGNWTSLPLLGQLPSLKSLYISNGRAVEYIGSEFFSGGFPQLEELTLREMGNWKSWCGAQKGECPKLKKFTIDGCHNLESLPPLGQLPSLRVLSISETSAVKNIGSEFFSGGFPQLEELTLSRMDNWKSWCGAQEGDCPKLKNLSIDGCPNLESLSLINLGVVEIISISGCPKLRCMPGHSLEVSHLQRAKTIKIQNICEVWCIEAAHLSTAAPVEDQPPCLQLEAVGRREAEYILGTWYHISQLTVKRCSKLMSLPFGFSHLIRQLTITECANLTSLPWTDLITLEYLMISECPLFQLLDAEQLAPTLLVLCIYGNPYETGQCSRHQHFQRLKQVQQCSNKEGGDRNLYLVFRNVHDASAAVKFCSMEDTEIHTLEIEWDCCTNDMSNDIDAVMKEVVSKLCSRYISSKKLVIRGYTGAGFPSCYADFFSKELCSDFLHSRLSCVSLFQCPKCEILPALNQLPFLEELHVGGANNLEIIVPVCLSSYDQMSGRQRQATYTSTAFPRLQKLEFHDMPVWREWLGTKEGDFPSLWKLVLKHCPKLRALPHLPPGLKELILEGCEELQSLSSSSQGLKSLTSLWRLSVTNCPNLDFTATEGPPPRLELMSLTGCPLLLAWCEGHPRMLANLSYLWVDGVQVSTEKFTSLE